MVIGNGSVQGGKKLRAWKVHHLSQSAIFVFIILLIFVVVVVVLDKGISLKYWFIAVCFIFLDAQFIACFAITATFYFFLNSTISSINCPGGIVQLATNL